MIAKDFHSAKDFRQIRGKSFVIMEFAVPLVRHSGYNGHAWLAGRPRRQPRTQNIRRSFCDDVYSPVCETHKRE
jgi:hypothetical protein